MPVRHTHLRQATLDDIERGEPVLTIEVARDAFVEEFGPPHSGHPADWDAAGPVELWFFELPWGHKVVLEYHLSIGQCNVFLDCLEIEAVIDQLGLRRHPLHVNHGLVSMLEANPSVFTEGLGAFGLYRLDDNGNTVLMQVHESRRVAAYHQKVYEDRGHKQLYWVEEVGSSAK